MRTGGEDLAERKINSAEAWGECMSCVKGGPVRRFQGERKRNRSPILQGPPLWDEAEKRKGMPFQRGGPERPLPFAKDWLETSRDNINRSDCVHVATGAFWVPIQFAGVRLFSRR